MLENCAILQNTFQKYLHVAVNCSLMYPQTQPGNHIKIDKKKAILLIVFSFFLFFQNYPYLTPHSEIIYLRGLPFLIFPRQNLLHLASMGFILCHKTSLTDESRNSAYGKPS